MEVFAGESCFVCTIGDCRTPNIKSILDNIAHFFRSILSYALFISESQRKIKYDRRSSCKIFLCTLFRVSQCADLLLKGLKGLTKLILVNRREF